MLGSLVRRYAFLPALVLTAIATSTFATTLPTPESLGLTPGQQYQFVFVTSGTTTATASAQSTYNTFVQNAADAAGIGSTLSLTWKAFVSTGTQASPNTAASNAPVSATTPVFLVNGTQVANGSTVPFYSISVDHLAAMNISELGTTVNRNVWTGSNANGSESGTGLLGQPADANGPVIGISSGTKATSGDPAGWARTGNNGNGQFSSAYSLYAISSVLVAPEPSSLALIGVAGIALVCRRKR